MPNLLKDFEQRMEALEKAKQDHDHLIGSWSTRLGEVQSRVTALESSIKEKPAVLPSSDVNWRNADQRITELERLVGDYQLDTDPMHPTSLGRFVVNLSRQLNQMDSCLGRQDSALGQLSERLDSIRPDLERLSALEAQVKDMDEGLGKLDRGVESMQPKTMMQAMVDLGAAEEVEQRQRKFSALVAEANEWVRKNKHTLALSAVTEALGLFSIPAAPKIKFRPMTPEEMEAGASRCGKTNAILADEMHKMGVPEDTIQRMLEGETQTGPKSDPLPPTTKPVVEGEIPTKEALSKPIKGVSPERAKEYDRLFKLGLEATKAILAGENPLDPWRHRSSEMRCKTCMWFTLKYVESNTLNDPTRPMATTLTKGPVGRCRRRAPTMSGYPVVYESDWCGDHKIDEAKA